MTSVEEHYFLKERARRILSLFKVPKSWRKERIHAWFQITGGAALAAYTYRNPAYEILPFMSSAIAVGGTYNFFKVPRKNFWSSYRNWSSWDLANGIFTFSTGVYAFNECWKENNRMWITCLPLAASGFHFASSAISSLDRFWNRKPLLKCCQLMFEPALVACAATYLFYFENLKEGWLKCLLLLVTGTTGLKIVESGCLRDGSMDNPQLLLLKTIELFMGGCILSTSCTALSVYTFAHDFCWPLTAFLTCVNLFGFFITIGSLTCLRRYIDIDIEVFFPSVGMIIAPFTISSAFVMVECLEKSDMVYPTFLFLIGTGQSILGLSFYHLYNRASRPVFKRYCQRVLGPVLTVYSSAVSAYAAYSLGWRFSLLTMPYIPAGIWVTYRGFKKVKRNHRNLRCHIPAMASILGD